MKMIRIRERLEIPTLLFFSILFIVVELGLLVSQASINESVSEPLAWAFAIIGSLIGIVLIYFIVVLIYKYLILEKTSTIEQKDNKIDRLEKELDELKKK
jgi:membrane protein DedA with SNARE-associated domain